MQKAIVTVMAAGMAIGWGCSGGVKLAGSTPAEAKPATTTAPLPAPVPSAAPAAPAEPDKAAVNLKSAEKRARQALAALKLDDPAKAAVVREIIVPHYLALLAWQEANDEQVADLWAKWRQARSGTPDEVKAAGITKHIDAVYATFAPQHDAFVAKLAEVLSPEQVETVKDSWTANKVRVTYNAYLAIFPILSEKQKAFTLANLKAAREQAIDARTMKEKSAFFKKYKLLIEAQFEREGIDTRQYRRDFAARQKAQAAARAAAASQATTQPATEPSGS